MNLQGKRVVVTGASQGLGLEIARAFVDAGAEVLLCARSAEGLERARQELDGGAKGRVFAKLCNVALESDVDALAEFARSTFGVVDVLVVNAGIYGPKGRIDEVTWSDWTDAIQVNLIGAVYCCRRFLSLLEGAQRGKVMIISGGGATKPLPFLSAYAASKAGLVRFGETFAEEVKTLGIDVNMIAPGALNTRMLDEVLQAGPDAVGEAFYQSAVKQRDSGGTPLGVGAELCVFLASEAADGVTGRLISAPWDPWRKLADFKDELRETDVYTLRRIVPAERGKDWEQR